MDQDTDMVSTSSGFIGYNLCVVICNVLASIAI